MHHCQPDSSSIQYQAIVKRLNIPAPHGRTCTFGCKSSECPIRAPLSTIVALIASLSYSQSRLMDGATKLHSIAVRKKKYRLRSTTYNHANQQNYIIKLPALPSSQQICSVYCFSAIPNKLNLGRENLSTRTHDPLAYHLYDSFYILYLFCGIALTFDSTNIQFHLRCAIA